MRLQKLSNGERFSITTAETLGSGGEARVYAVPGDNRWVAKIYHHPTEQHYHKLRAMLANPPEESAAVQTHSSIAWPVDLLAHAYGDRSFAGFLMPRVSAMRPIFNIYNPSSRRKFVPLFNYRYLHRAARNLASAVRVLHSRGYVIGDVNESNILVSDSALITLVDTDSFQVRDPVSKVNFRCPVGKPEYTPPELQGKRFSAVDRTPENDLFGLGVLLFQILMEGAHPFAGLYQGVGDAPTYETRILAGHFPYGDREVPYKPMPTAPTIDILNPSLRQLFLQCFDQGHTSPSARPDAQTWQAALTQAEQDLLTCEINPRHVYGHHLPECPWCKRTVLLGGRDPFPEKPEDAATIPRRIPASSLLKPQNVAPPVSPVPVPLVSGSAQAPANRVPSTGSLPVNASQTLPSWAGNASLSASVNAGTTGTPSAPNSSLRLFENGWAWGGMGWAMLSITALSLGLTGLSTATSLLAVAFGIAGLRTALRPGGKGRWITLFSLSCALLSVGARTALGPGPAAAHTLSAKSGGILSLSFSPDGKTLASGTGRVEETARTGGQVNLWDIRSEEYKETLAEYRGDVVSVSFSPNGKTLAVATDTPFGSGEIFLLNSEIHGDYRSLGKERHHLQQALFSPDGRYVAAAAKQRDVTIWDAETQIISATLEEPSEVRTIAFSPDGQRLAVGTESVSGSVIPGKITMWDISTGHSIWTQNAHGNGVRNLAFAPDSRTLASGGIDGALCFWDVSSGHLIRRMTGHSYLISCLAWSSDGAYLATGEASEGDNGTLNELNLRDAKTGDIVKTLSRQASPIQAVVFAPDSKTLASGARDGTIRIWSIH